MRARDPNQRKADWWDALWFIIAPLSFLWLWPYRAWKKRRAERGQRPTEPPDDSN